MYLFKVVHESVSPNFKLIWLIPTFSKYLPKVPKNLV